MRDLFLNCGSYLLFEKANLPNEQRDSQNRSQPIGHRACMPQAFERIVENVRQNEYGRNQENQLTRERKKNTFASIADALEKRRRHNLQTYDRKHHNHAAQCVGRHFDEFGRILGKQASKGSGKKVPVMKPVSVMPVPTTKVRFSTLMTRS